MTCSACSSSGMVLHDGKAYRCTCEAGEKFAGDQFLASDKKKERPFQIPVWQNCYFPDGAPEFIPMPKISGRDRAAGKDD